MSGKAPVINRRLDHIARKFARRSRSGEIAPTSRAHHRAERSNTGVGQYLSYEALELQQFFLEHVMLLVNDQPNAARVEHGRGLAGLCRV